MPEEEVVERARKDEEEGRSPSTQAKLRGRAQERPAQRSGVKDTPQARREISRVRRAERLLEHGRGIVLK